MTLHVRVMRLTGALRRLIASSDQLSEIRDEFRAQIEPPVGLFYEAKEFVRPIPSHALKYRVGKLILSMTVVVLHEVTEGVEILQYRVEFH